MCAMVIAKRDSSSLADEVSEPTTMLAQEVVVTRPKKIRRVSDSDSDFDCTSTSTSTRQADVLPPSSASTLISPITTTPPSTLSKKRRSFSDIDTSLTRHRLDHHQTYDSSAVVLVSPSLSISLSGNVGDLLRANVKALEEKLSEVRLKLLFNELEANVAKRKRHEAELYAKLAIHQGTTNVFNQSRRQCPPVIHSPTNLQEAVDGILSLSSSSRKKQQFSIDSRYNE